MTNQEGEKTTTRATAAVTTASSSTTDNSLIGYPGTIRFANCKRYRKRYLSYDKTQLDVAVDMVLKNKLSMRAAAHIYKIPFSTLRTRKVFLTSGLSVTEYDRLNKKASNHRRHISDMISSSANGNGQAGSSGGLMSKSAGTATSSSNTITASESNGGEEEEDDDEFEDVDEQEDEEEEEGAVNRIENRNKAKNRTNDCPFVKNEPIEASNPFEGNMLVNGERNGERLSNLLKRKSKNIRTILLQRQQLQQQQQLQEQQRQQQETNQKRFYITHNRMRRILVKKINNCNSNSGEFAASNGAGSNLSSSWLSSLIQRNIKITNRNLKKINSISINVNPPPPLPPLPPLPPSQPPQQQQQARVLSTQPQSTTTGSSQPFKLSSILSGTKLSMTNTSSNNHRTSTAANLTQSSINNKTTQQQQQQQQPVVIAKSNQEVQLKNNSNNVNNNNKSEKLNRTNCERTKAAALSEPIVNNSEFLTRSQTANKRAYKCKHCNLMFVNSFFLNQHQRDFSTCLAAVGEEAARGEGRDKNELEGISNRRAGNSKKDDRIVYADSLDSCKHFTCSFCSLTTLDKTSFLAHVVMCSSC